jgi:chromatin structure-remodeling complex subunit SFH1
MDAGALDSEDSDFQGRASRQRAQGTSSAMGVFNSTTGTSRSYGSPAPPQQAAIAPERAGLDHSYLGMLPPARFITAKAVPMSLAGPTMHDFPYVIFTSTRTLYVNILKPTGQRSRTSRET